MAKLLVNNKLYGIEFRHISKHGRKAQLHKGSVQAVTTCVVIANEFIAIDNSLCADGDTYSRRQGRMRALNKLLDHCGPLRRIKAEFFNAYLVLDPDPLPVPERVRPTEEQIARRREVGQIGKEEKRNQRKERRRQAKDRRRERALMAET